MSADDRREAVLDAAMIEFGLGGYVGTSTESIARRVGVSQPYLFRLFPSKKAIFLAAVERCFDRIQTLFETAADGLTGDEAMSAMGTAYNGLLDNRQILQMQLQMWASACSDEEVRDATRRRMGRLLATVERLAGLDEQRLMQFMAYGMLLNVLGAMDIERVKDQLGAILAGLAKEPLAAGDIPAADTTPSADTERSAHPAPAVAETASAAAKTTPAKASTPRRGKRP
jgi:AcrR family transcriptional regulator